MVRCGERGLGRDRSHEMVDLSFELLWDIDVLDPPTIDADEMVMVSGKPFSQFVSRRSLRGQVRDDDLCLLKHGPVSYTHLTLPTTSALCRYRWSPYH